MNCEFKKLEHLTKFLRNPIDVCEFIIDLLLILYKLAKKDVESLQSVVIKAGLKQEALEALT